MLDQTFYKRGKKVLKNFCLNSPISGLKYIAEDGHWIKRLMGVVVFLGGIAFSTYFCIHQWNKWVNSPVLTSVDSLHYQLHQAPFPAVTICSVNKISKRKLQDTISKDARLTNVPPEHIEEALWFITGIEETFTTTQGATKLQSLLTSANISSSDLFHLLEKSSPSCQDMILECLWLNKPKPCMEHFSLIPTNEGLCCTFNGLKYTDRELGIDTENFDTFNISGNGYRAGLSLVMDADIADYQAPNNNFDGFKVLVHNSKGFADVSRLGFVIGPGVETFAAVKKEITKSTEEVIAKVHVSKRGCYGKKEKKLTLFPSYSQSGCKVECAARHIQKLFGCRPYFFRNLSNVTKLCDLDKYRSIFELFEDVNQHYDRMCDCLPACDDVHYYPELSRAPIGNKQKEAYQNFVRKHNLIDDVSTKKLYRSNAAKLHIFMKENTAIEHKMDVRFEVADFIADMGGLVGMGLGLSFISIIELLYHIFIKGIYKECTAPPQQEVQDMFDAKESQRGTRASSFLFRRHHKRNTWYTGSTPTKGQKLFY